MTHYEKREAARLRRQKIGTGAVITLAIAVLVAVGYVLAT